MEIADAINQAQREAREADEQVVAARRASRATSRSPRESASRRGDAGARCGGASRWRPPRLIDEDEGLPPPTRRRPTPPRPAQKLLPDVSAGLVSTLLGPCST